LRLISVLLEREALRNTRGQRRMNSMARTIFRRLCLEKIDWMNHIGPQ
jgi:hypothetical protein